MGLRRTSRGRRRGHNYRRQRDTAPRRVNPEDVAVGLTLDETQAIVGDMFDAKADGTKDVYEKHWRYFTRWYGRLRAETPELGAGQSRPLLWSELVTDHVRVYLKASRANRHRSVSWLCCAVAAIRGALAYEGLDHQVDWDRVGSDLRTYRRKDRTAHRGVDGITRELFEMIEAAAPRPMDGEWPDLTRRRAAFDLALIALMRDCLLRRSEAAAVTWGHIKVERKPGHVYGALTIPSGKTDQYGKGEVAYIHVSTLARLQEMAVACGKDPTNPKQLVFGITDGQMARRIKRACAHAGLMGKFSGHSPRVGMAMDLATYDTPLVGVMQSGRWRMPSTVMGYIRSIAVGDGAVSRLHRRWNRVAMSGPVPAEEWT